jgi:hypothetical protein
MRIETLCSIYEAFNRGDIETVSALLDPHGERPAWFEELLRSSDALGGIELSLVPEDFLQRSQRVLVVVHQRVRRRNSDVLDNCRVGHVFTFQGSKVV